MERVRGREGQRERSRDERQWETTMMREYRETERQRETARDRDRKRQTET